MKDINYNLIKAKIVASGYKQKELADILDVTEVTISNWCNGKLGNIDKFINLCLIIDLDLRELKK